MELKTDALWLHLHWLTVLAEQGSFTRAAERLEGSKAAGEKLVSELRAPFAEIEQSFYAVRDSSGPLRGLVRITAPVAFARQQLQPHIGDFLRLHPQVRIQLEVTDRLVSLASEGFDLAIRHSNALPETHVAQLLCETRPLLVASPGWLAQHGEPQHPNELSQHSCLYYPRGTESPRWRFSDPAQPQQETVVNVSGPFATNNSESIRDAALDGLGIAMLPDFSARQALGEGRLRQLLPQWRIQGAFASHIWIVRPWAARVPRAVTELSQWLRHRFQVEAPR